MAAILRLGDNWNGFTNSAGSDPTVNKEKLQKLEDTGLDFAHPVLAIEWRDYSMKYQQEIAERINRVHNTFNRTNSLRAKLANLERLVRYCSLPLHFFAQDSHWQTSKSVEEEFKGLAANAKSHSRWTEAQVNRVPSALVCSMLLTKGPQ